MIDLGTLGGTYAQAYAISESGVVTGCSSLPFGEIHPFIWDAASGMRDIGVAGSSHCGLGINDAGFVAGDLIGSTASTAVIWDGGTWIPIFRRGNSEAAAINDQGLVAGTLQSGAGPRAYLWSSGASVSYLPTFPGDLGSQATALNRCGVAAGMVIKATSAWHATVWGGGC